MQHQGEGGEGGEEGKEVKIPKPLEEKRTGGGGRERPR